MKTMTDIWEVVEVYCKSPVPVGFQGSQQASDPAYLYHVEDICYSIDVKMT